MSVAHGTSILNAGRLSHEMKVECCGLTPPCGRCRVTVIEGEHNLSKITPLEAETAEIFGYLPFERVACLARVMGDVLVEIRE